LARHELHLKSRRDLEALELLLRSQRLCVRLIAAHLFRMQREQGGAACQCHCSEGGELHGAEISVTVTGCRICRSWLRYFRASPFYRIPALLLVVRRLLLPLAIAVTLHG